MPAVGRLIGTLLLGGILYGLAFPPYDLGTCAWFALVPLICGVRRRRPSSAFFYGVLYGYVCAAAVSGWLVQALARFFDLSFPLAFALGSVYALVFWGIAFGLFAAAAATLLLEPSTPLVRMALPAVWVAVELFRGRGLGQPWGLLGYTQHAHIGLIQLAALTGVYGVSFLIAFANVAVADAFVSLRERRPRVTVAALALPAVLILPIWCVGALTSEGGPIGGFAGRTVAVVQTNIEPVREWTRSYTDRQLRAHIAATEAIATKQRPGLVVWPEYAVPRYLEAEPLVAVNLAELAARYRFDLLFGTPRFDAGHSFNSIRLITGDGRNGGAYDKQRLVLLAEEKPFASHSTAPVDNPVEFTAGDGPGVLRGFVSFGLSICHEVLFPELATAEVAAGAELLVNVSNDGWIDAGRGIAGRQHLAMAAFRAVETRRYLVRAATTGPSAVVDPYGRITDSLPPRTSGVLTAPVAARTTVTPYVYFGDAFALWCVLIAGLAVMGRYTASIHRYSRIVSTSPNPLAVGRTAQPR